MARRYIIVGAGAVGGAIGGALALARSEVVLVARGAHLDAIRSRGLSLVTPDATHLLRLPVEARVHDVAFREGDVVILATKSQDTEAALAGFTDAQIPIVCAQNGVANERFAKTRFANVYGMLVFAPLQHLEPGIVSIHAAPRFGGLDVGRHPSGDDALATEIAGELSAAGFDVRVRADIQRWKYGKLLSNLGNAMEAIGGRAAMTPERIAQVNEEAEACLRAAKIEHASLAEVFERFANIHEVGARGGGSTWQSLSRGLPLETDLLNGEIVRLGALHGIATPLNAALIGLARRAMNEHWKPGENADAITPIFRAGT